MSIIIALIISSMSSIAQPSYFDSLNMRYVGDWPFAPANDMAVDSARNIVFMASGGGILVFSMDSTPPYLLSSLKFRYKVVSLLYDDSSQRLYAGFGGYGLGIFDVSDPSNPYLVACSGDQRDNSTPYEMRIYNDYIVATGVNSHVPVLLFYDLTNLSDLFFYGYPLTHGAGGLDIRDRYVFVTEGNGGIEVIDILRPARPSRVSSYSDGKYMTDIKISGNYAYVAEHDSGVAIINISNVHSLQPVGQVYFNGMEEILSVFIKDSLLYMADPWGSLWIADVNNPYAPAFVNRVRDLGFPVKVAVYDTLAYVLGRFETGTYLMNVADPTNISIIKNTGGFEYSERLTLSGNTVFLSYGPSGTFLLDVSDPSDPRLIGHIDGNIYYAVEDSPFVFVTKNDTGMAIYDISDPRHPQLISSIDSILTYKVIPQDSFVYVSEYPNIILKINISDPAHPVITAQHYLAGRIVDFAITDSNAVVLTTSYLYVIDLTDLHETFTTGVLINSYGGVVIQDSFVYVAKDMYPEIIEYGLANDSLYQVTTVDSSFNTGVRVAISGHYLYIGDLYYGVRVFDISNYLNIYEVAHYAGFTVLDIAASNGYAFLSTGNMGLQIFALSGVGVNEDNDNVLPTQFLISHGKKVRLMLPAMKGGTLEIYDASGRKVYSCHVSGNEFEINLPGEGVYLWKYTVGKRVLSRGKILVVN